MNDKILNFRDLGNKVSSEGTVKSGMIYRGGPLYKLDQSTIERLQQEYNISTIVDFRDDNEIKYAPDMQDGFEYYHLNIVKEIHDQTADPEELIKLRARNSPKALMTNLYIDIIHDQYAQKQYRRFIDILLHATGSVYFHCSAGKDRTGIGAALILKMLGVSDEVIFEDYMLTNLPENNRIQIAIEEAKNNGTYCDTTEEDMRAFVGVMPEYLEAANREINKHYGDFNQYISSVLGIDEQTISQLKIKYLFKK